MTNELTFPPEIEATAFRLRSEYAWQKKDLKPVLDFCLRASLAILGGEVWVVRRVEDCQPDEPTEPLHNLDANYRRKGSVLARTPSHVVYGLLPVKDGGPLCVFGWTAGEIQGQSWVECVTKTVELAQAEIERGDVERNIIAEYSPFIFYNLVFKQRPLDQGRKPPQYA